jgi:hypothetical protein
MFGFARNFLHCIRNGIIMPRGPTPENQRTREFWGTGESGGIGGEARYEDRSTRSSLASSAFSARLRPGGEDRGSARKRQKLDIPISNNKMNIAIGVGVAIDRREGVIVPANNF